MLAYVCVVSFFFFKQKTAYEMRISDWSSDVCSSDLTKYGSVVALPSFLFSLSRIVSGYCGGLSGVHAMWAGADWTWHKPVLRGDIITTQAYLKDLVEQIGRAHV